MQTRAPISHPYVLSALLNLLLLLPPLAYVSLHLSSPSAGILAACIIALIVFRRAQEWPRTWQWVLVATIILSILTMGHLSLANVSLTKQLASLCILVAVILTGNALGYSLVSSASDIRTIVSIGYLLLAGLALLALTTGLAPGHYGSLNHAFFPFSEPSHFAVVFAPLTLFVSLILSSRWRFCPPVALAALGAATPNLTMLVAAFMISIVLMRPVLAAVAAAVTVAALASSMHLLPAYFAERLACQHDLSCLVYLQGWEMAYSSFKQTYGLGLGFQNLSAAEHGNYAQIIPTKSGGQELNRHDGSFLAAKIVGEFGVLGIGIVLAVSFTIFQSVWRIMTSLQMNMPPIDALQHSLTAGFSLELWFRGLGYFSSGVVLYVAALEISRRRSSNFGPTSNSQESVLSARRQAAGPVSPDHQ